MSLLNGGVPAIAGGSPVRRSFLTFGAPSIGNEEIREVVDTLRSGWIGFGPKCLRLEMEFARYVQASHAISLSSCTAGLHLALIAAGVEPGDEVITTPLTFPATVNVIEHVRARPIFVDVKRDSQNIDPDGIAAAVSARTKAIVPVHMAGRPCDMGAINDIGVRHGLVVVEDAAHAIEAAWQDQKIGSISKFTAFSFYATKNLTTAEGGMLTTNDAEAAEKIRTLRLHGISRNAWERYSVNGGSSYDTLMPGYKYNLTDLQASLGLNQLACLDARLSVREDHWQRYTSAFADLEGFIETPPPVRGGDRHARHLYTVLLKTEHLDIDRDQFVRALRAENVGAGVHFVPVHLHEYYRHKYDLAIGAYPNAEHIGGRTISLPLSSRLLESDVQDVIAAVRKLVAHYSRTSEVARQA